MQRYSAGDFYEAHLDFSDQDGYRRVATFLLYLTTVEEGGETVFPFITRAPATKVGSNGGGSGSGLATEPVYRADVGNNMCKEVICTAEQAEAMGAMKYCCCGEILNVST